MVFPSTARNIKVDLFVNGAWTDITADVYSRDDIEITYGKPDQDAATEPASCSMTLKYQNGKYNPRNPLGTYFGSLGRNTPIRVRLALGPDNYRFWGEVPSWPPQRDGTGKDAWVSIVAAGRLRRVSRGNRPLYCAAKQYYLGTSPIAYWPLMDGSGSKWGWMASGSSYRYPWVASNSTVQTELGAGELGPQGNSLSITTTTTGFGAYSGGYSVGSAADGTAFAGEFLFKSDDLGGELWFIIQDSHQYPKEWSLQIRADGTNDDIQLWRLNRFEDDSYTQVALANTAPLDAVTDKKLHHVRLYVEQDGGGWQNFLIYVDGVQVMSTSDLTGTIATIQHPRHTRFQYIAAADAAPVSIGHVIVWEGANIPPIAESSAAGLAYIGEVAGRRMERLFGESGTAFVSSGDLDDTLAMGYQFIDTFANEIAEVEATDMGMLYEPRDSTAVGYRTRESLYNQAATITIDAAAGELGSPFDPVDDDQNLHNDITAQRRDGATYQVSQTTGPLSVSEPPTGAGRYEDQVTVNVETDEMLPATAGAALVLGTVNEARYKSVTVDLGNKHVVANATLTAAVLAAKIGDRIVITNAEAFNIYDDVSLIILGYNERLNTHTHKITFTCVPESPYRVMEFDLTTTWLDPGTSTTLNEDMTTTETGMDVAVIGPLWTTSAGLPVSIMVGGEEMTVTAISGASSPQTMTVTRSVNGVVKTHLTGAAVALKIPGILAL